MKLKRKGVPRKPVEAEAIHADIRSGLSDVEIMEKHRITRRILNHSLKTLVGGGKISQSEIDHRGDYFFRRIKRLTIIAMFSDDELMNRLVLKGGNALEIVHSVNSRSSKDLDFSIEGEFSQDQVDAITGKIEKCLKGTFNSQGYEVFDVIFIKKPPELTPDMADFWGGYQVEFKVIRTKTYYDLGSDLASLRNYAEEVDASAKKKFTIDISKFEYCTPKQEKELDNHTIYVYSPDHIVIEKIRSICQQMPEYGVIVKSQSLSPRSRDFFDIYSAIEHFRIDLTTPENIDLIKCSFESKKVPLELIGRIRKYREYHRQAFDAVKATVYPSTELLDFDFYFDYVVEKCEQLKTLWEE